MSLYNEDDFDKPYKDPIHSIGINKAKYTVKSGKINKC